MMTRDEREHGITPMMRTVFFTITDVTPDIVFLVDNDAGGMSVTNAAELVVFTVTRKFPHRRIVYRDSEGRWDELVHEHGRFRGFRPYRRN